MGAPFETAAEIRAAAKIQVAEIVAKVEAARQAGGHAGNQRAIHKAYRLGQVAKGEKVMPYPKFLQRFTASMVRDVAVTGRMV